MAPPPKHSFSLNPEPSTLDPTGWGPLVISRVIRALNWVIRTLS